MATFVIVHGGFGGGWEWTPVARLLRARGHEAFTPTLTGMGERAHLGSRHVGLSTHVADVVALVEFEALRDVVLCGASYGGMPATGAADRLADRVRVLVYVDALVPRDGERALDFLPASFQEFAREAAAADPDGWRVPAPDAVLPPAGLVPEERRADYARRLRPQPFASYDEPIRLSGAVERLPRAFVRCTRTDFGEELGDPIAPFAARARAEGWAYRELAAPHDPQLADPAATAEALHDLAGRG